MQQSSAPNNSIPPRKDGKDLESAPLRSVHTSSFPEILDLIAASVWVTTYQAGKLVVLRHDAGMLNTHFRNLNKPMGLAQSDGKLAIGCNIDIWEYHNVPVVCKQLDESGDYPSNKAKHDGCFLPRRSHCTGDVQIHEMAWQQNSAGSSELNFVNTTFSCIAKRSEENSFEPIWRPGFIKRLMPGDNCHLNGLAMRDGRPAYVTALGDRDEPNAWRENKRDGGILIDYDSKEIIASGLSMPHSPRWYNDQLWLLESGDGTIGTVDMRTGKYEPIASFPGFTRGLSFYGPLAFVGLSQIRESAVFSGIPLVDRLKNPEDRACGVWILNIETGQTLGFCQFEGSVQEIFAVEVIPGMRFPDLINHDPKLIGHSYVLGDDALQCVPENMKA